MIPAIGVMVGAYIALRCCEIFATLDRIQSQKNRAVIGIMAAGVLVVTVVCAIEILGSGVAARQILDEVSPTGIFKPPQSFGR